MKKMIVTSAFALSLILVGCGSEKEVAKFDGLKDYTDSLNYAIGIATGNRLRQDSLTLNENLVVLGLKEVMEGKPMGGAMANRSDSVCNYVGRSIAKTLLDMHYEVREAVVTQGLRDLAAGKPLMDEAKCQRFIMAFVTAERQRNQPKQNPNQPPQPDPRISQENRMKGEAFLAQNKSEAGVKVTASGLQYKAVKKGGGGKSPTVADEVKCHYKGTLLDGSTFDSSYDRGEPATFALNRVIQGWQEGIPLMKVGDKFEFWIPADLAYGENGPPNIGPGQVLKFEVELLEINPKKG